MSFRLSVLACIISLSLPVAAQFVSRNIQKGASLSLLDPHGVRLRTYQERLADSY